MLPQKCLDMSPPPPQHFSASDMAEWQPSGKYRDHPFQKQTWSTIKVDRFCTVYLDPLLPNPPTVVTTCIPTVGCIVKKM